MERGEEGKVARGYTERGGEGVLREVKRGEGHSSVEIVHSF